MTLTCAQPHVSIVHTASKGEDPEPLLRDISAASAL